MPPSIESTPGPGPGPTEYEVLRTDVVNSCSVRSNPYSVVARAAPDRRGVSWSYPGEQNNEFSFATDSRKHRDTTAVMGNDLAVSGVVSSQLVTILEHRADCKEARRLTVRSIAPSFELGDLPECLAIFSARRSDNTPYVRHNGRNSVLMCIHTAPLTGGLLVPSTSRTPIK